MTTKFFFCATCGNVVVNVADSGVSPFCCGQEMKELVPMTTETMAEKHLPEIHLKEKDNTLLVKVGALPHPMTPDHHIRFIYLETENGGQIRYLDPAKPAEACFCLGKEVPVAVYAYCNIHGLWKTDVKCEAKPDRKCCKRF